MWKNIFIFFLVLSLLSACNLEKDEKPTLSGIDIGTGASCLNTTEVTIGFNGKDDRATTLTFDVHINHFDLVATGSFPNGTDVFVDIDLPYSDEAVVTVRVYDEAMNMGETSRTVCINDGQEPEVNIISIIPRSGGVRLGNVENTLFIKDYSGSYSPFNCSCLDIWDKNSYWYGDVTSFNITWQHNEWRVCINKTISISIELKNLNATNLKYKVLNTCNNSFINIDMY